MAGVGIELDRNLTLDVGYRFVNLGDIGVTGPATRAGAVVGTSTLEIDDIYSHEFRIGIRIGLNGH